MIEYTSKEAAALLGLNRMTFLYLVQKKNLQPSRKVSGLKLWLWSEEDIDRLKQELQAYRESTYSLKEIASLCGLGTRRTKALMNENGIKHGDYWRYPKAEVDRFLALHQSKKATNNT